MAKKIALVFTAVISSFSCSSAFSKIDACFEIFPYVGLDAQIRHMTFEEGFGDNTLRHSSPQGNGYAGFRFHDYFGIEGGYESTVTRARTKTLFTGDVAAGMPIQAGFSPIVFRSKIKIQGPHINLLGLYPLYEYNGCPVEILGSVGAGFLKATSIRQTVSIMGAPASTIRTLIGRKTVLRTTAGLQYRLGQHLGIRGTVGWAGTSRLVISGNDNISGKYLPEVKPKSTAFCGLGLLWAF